MAAADLLTRARRCASSRQCLANCDSANGTASSESTEIETFDIAHRKRASPRLQVRTSETQAIYNYDDIIVDEDDEAGNDIEGIAFALRFARSWSSWP